MNMLQTKFAKNLLAANGSLQAKLFYCLKFLSYCLFFMRICIHCMFYFVGLDPLKARLQRNCLQDLNLVMTS